MAKHEIAATLAADNPLTIELRKIQDREAAARAVLADAVTAATAMREAAARDLREWWDRVHKSTGVMPTVAVNLHVANGTDGGLEILRCHRPQSVADIMRDHFGVDVGALVTKGEA